MYGPGALGALVALVEKPLEEEAANITSIGSVVGCHVEFMAGGEFGVAAQVSISEGLLEGLHP